MISFPNAKLNLGLNILEKREDGFHNIETVFYPVPFSDVLEVIPDKMGQKGKATFSATGISIPGEKADNLCLKAYDLLKGEFKLPAVKIHLHKIIPMGAGLGGGSADAAFVIKSLNQLFNLQLNDGQMENYASQLGSDCPFFIQNKPVFAFGKGDEFQEIKLDLSRYFAAIVYPDLHISTPEAYGSVKPAFPEKSIKEIIQLPIAKWKENLVNGFEKPLINKYEVIGKVKDTLYDLGAVYASMTGSGSAVFGLFDKEVKLKDKLGSSLVWSGKL